MLSKNYDEKKLQFPCYISRKYDGVPVIFWIEDGILKMSSRQGKPILSIPHIYDDVKRLVDENNLWDLENEVIIVGELIIPGWNFKDISGKVRKGDPCYDLQLEVFYASPEIGLVINPFNNLHFIHHTECHTLEDVQRAIKEFPEEWEGIMIITGPYMSAEGDAKPIRSWNSMKFKREPTVDLKVVGIEEAIDKHGEPKGMLGSFQCEYKDTVINVGPGKMKHDERIKVFQEPLLKYGRVIEVKYMKDDSYDALRQPTFQQWREDKNESDVSYD